MSRKLIAAALLATITATTPLVSLASQPPPNATEMASLQYLLGTWHCTWTTGKTSGAEDQIFRSALDGAWLEEKEVVNVRGEERVISIHYTGYDPRIKAYVHVGPDASGSYEVAQSPDADVWQSTDGSFIHHKVSDTRRTMMEMDSTGKSAQLTMTCAKTSFDKLRMTGGAPSNDSGRV